MYSVDVALGAAFLWAHGSGIVHANTPARIWTADLVQSEILGAAAAECNESRRADIVDVAGGAFLLLPLMEARARNRYVFAIQGYDLRDAPWLLHDLHETEAPGAPLPVSLPQANGLSFDVAYRSADLEAPVGGDWYDGFTLPDGLIAFSIGDVARHGVNAAFIMGHVRKMVRTGAMRGLTPHDVFASANEEVLAAGYGLISAFLGYIDPLTLEMKFAVAGHPAPMLVGSDGTVDAIAGGGDEILGATHSARYRGNELTLADTTALVLYTDGVTEHSRGLDTGEAALIAILAAWGRNGFDAYALEILTLLLAEKPIRDDAALMVLRALPLSRFDEMMLANPASSRRARSAVRRALKQSELGSRSEEFVLAICEAVNNAIEHGSPRPGDRVRVLLESDDAVVHGVVESAGPWRNEKHSIERGRGLLLMRAICDRVTVDVRDPGASIDLYMDIV